MEQRKTELVGGDHSSCVPESSSANLSDHHDNHLPQDTHPIQTEQRNGNVEVRCSYYVCESKAIECSHVELDSLVPRLP